MTFPDPLFFLQYNITVTLLASPALPSRGLRVEAVIQPPPGDAANRTLGVYAWMPGKLFLRQEIRSWLPIRKGNF
ncbi:hypothetical protein OUZ56_024268 [Daphnia magna]|uniref:Uncharacterized protein n=1 Tax=Daphnia magna TaxID=35525 RepID=A0ABR0B0G9_9CRUS|nr:hypothetical protein OUZ56_024268 [Daphnia magna]